MAKIDVSGVGWIEGVQSPQVVEANSEPTDTFSESRIVGGMKIWFAPDSVRAFDNMAKADYRFSLIVPGTAPQAPFEVALPDEEVARRSDKCSLAPDGIPGVADFGPACVAHDVAYYVGGSQAARRSADKKLAKDMKDAGSPAIIASIYRAFTNAFGNGGVLHDTAVLLGKDPFKWGFGETSTWRGYARDYWKSRPAAEYAEAFAAEQTKIVQASNGGLLANGTRWLGVTYDRPTNALTFRYRLPSTAPIAGTQQAEARIRERLATDRGADGALYQRGVRFNYLWTDASEKEVFSLSLHHGDRAVPGSSGQP